jgi:hypothetical protein
MAKRAQRERAYVFREEHIRTFRNSDSADPNKIGTALWKLAQENGGRLEPDRAVAAARAPGHALHKHLTWNDSDAAHSWRVREMQSIIRSICLVEPEEHDPPRRGWLSVDDASGVSYHALDEVLGSRDLQLSVLRRALRDLQAFEDRYRELEDICSMVKTARSVLQARLASHVGGQQEVGAPT